MKYVYRIINDKDDRSGTKSKYIEQMPLLYKRSQHLYSMLDMNT